MQSRILALTGLMAVFAPQVSRLSAAVETPVPESHLRLFHTHTGERIDVVFRRGGEYVTAGLDQLNHFLRDHRSQNLISISIEKDVEDCCAVCGERGEPAEGDGDDTGKTVCANCGAELVK